jgi:hypothetical protein
MVGAGQELDPIKIRQAARLLVGDYGEEAFERAAALENGSAAPDFAKAVLKEVKRLLKR